MFNPLIFLMTFAPFFTSDSVQWGTHEPSASWIRVQDTTRLGALAEVEFKNEAVHPYTEVMEFKLEYDGVVFEVETLVGRGNQPDTLEVLPPEGYIAVPPFLSVAEGEIGVIYIYEIGVLTG